MTKPLVDLERLEAELSDCHLPLPPGFESLARLSGEAVMKQYEATAKMLDELAEEVHERIGLLQAAMIQADTDLRVLQQAGAAILARGTAAREQVDEAARVSKAVRDLCAATQRKIGV